MSDSLLPRSAQSKRVGASVVIDAQGAGLNPYIQGPQLGYPGIVQPGIGIPNPGCCPCPPPFFPPMPFPIGGFPGYPGYFPGGEFPLFPGEEDDIIIDDPNVPTVVINAGVAPQTINAGSTAQVLLTSAMSSVGGAYITGNSIILPVRGTYNLSINITVSRPLGSTGGIVSFILNGGVSGSSNIASAALSAGSTQVLSGTVSLRTNSRNTSVSILANNGGGSLQILGGTVSVQLTSR